MAVLVDVDLEDGTLDEFDATLTDGGQLSAEVGAALAGTAEGLQAVIDDTNNLSGRADFTWTTSDLRVRFYIDMNGLTMADGDQFTIIQSAGGGMHNVFLNKTGSNYTISTRVAVDGGSAYNAAFTLSDAPHYVEIHQQRASTNSASDGFVKIYLDGVEQDAQTGLDIFDTAATSGFWLGPLDLDAGTSGTMYLDQLIVNDDGGEIGAHASGGSDAPTRRAPYPSLYQM